MIPTLQLGATGWRRRSAPAAAGIDPHFSLVKLLLHGDGANNSTVFTDHSSAPKTVSVFGNSKISTVWSKFGGASIDFDGAGDYLTVPGVAADFYPNTDLTVEMWFRPRVVAVVGRLCGFSNAAGGVGTWILSLNSDNRFLFNGSDASSYKTAWSTTLAVVDTPVFIVGQKRGDYFEIYINGVLEGTSPILTSALVSLSSPLAIGRMGDHDAAYLNGYIDDFRVTNGVARYTSNFTPPTEAFPNS